MRVRAESFSVLPQLFILLWFWVEFKDRLWWMIGMNSPP
jgi:hypothetical protein